RHGGKSASVSGKRERRDAVDDGGQCRQQICQRSLVDTGGQLVARASDSGQRQNRVDGHNRASRPCRRRGYLAHNCSTRSLRIAIDRIAMAATPVPQRDFSATPHSTAAGGIKIIVTKYVRTKPVGTGLLAPKTATIPTTRVIMSNASKIVIA